MTKTPERVLCLDMSTKTGWSLGLATEEAYSLLEHGAIEKIDKPNAKYPSDYVLWARLCHEKITALIFIYKPDVLVIEETSKGSKNNFSQKILEFIHFLVAQTIMNLNLNVKYLMTGEWRDAVGARMSKEESKRNAKARKIKEKTGQKLAKDEDGKVIGKITKKHVNVRRANEIFGLNLKVKDNDAADAILLGYGYYMINWKGHQRKNKNESL